MLAAQGMFFFDTIRPLSAQVFLDQSIPKLADSGEAIDGSDFCCGS